MIHFPEMRQFVGDNVIDDMRREMDQAPVETDAAATAATAPARPCRGQRQRRRCQPEAVGEILQASGKPDESPFAQGAFEHFTGGDIAYGPETLRLDPATPRYAHYRRTNPLRQADLFHTAHNHLHDLGVADGPLRWSPSATSPQPYAQPDTRP